MRITGGNHPGLAVLKARGRTGGYARVEPSYYRAGISCNNRGGTARVDAVKHARQVVRLAVGQKGVTKQGNRGSDRSGIPGG